MREAGPGPERGDVVGGAVGVGSALAVSGYQAVHQAGIVSGHRVEIQSRAAQRGGPDVGEENICAAEQFECGRPAVVGGQVEYDAALAAIVHLERRAHVLDASTRPNMRAGSPVGGSILMTSAP